MGAGAGEEVFYVRGREASFPFLPAEVPTDAAIVGIVDHWQRGARWSSARVVGNVVATQKNEKLEGAKLLLVQPLDLDGRAAGRAVLAIDGVDAGIGDRVLLVQDGKAAQQVLGRGTAAVDAAMVGVVDAVELGGLRRWTTPASAS